MSESLTPQHAEFDMLDELPRFKWFQTGMFASQNGEFVQMRDVVAWLVNTAPFKIATDSVVEQKQPAVPLEDAGSSPVAVHHHTEPGLDKKAQVGATVFGVGVKWSTVIDRAQREWDYFHGLKNPRSSPILPEPTKEMWDAGAMAITELYRGEGGWCGVEAALEQARITWHAMIALAPHTPSETKREITPADMVNVLREASIFLAENCQASLGTDCQYAADAIERIERVKAKRLADG